MNIIHDTKIQFQEQVNGLKGNSKHLVTLKPIILHHFSVDVINIVNYANSESHLQNSTGSSSKQQYQQPAN